MKHLCCCLLSVCYIFSQWSACNDLTQGSLSYPNFNYEEILTVFFFLTASAMFLGILTNGNLNSFKITISGFGTFPQNTRAQNTKQKFLIYAHKKLMTSEKWACKYASTRK